MCVCWMVYIYVCIYILCIYIYIYIYIFIYRIIYIDLRYSISLTFHSSLLYNNLICWCFTASGNILNWYNRTFCSSVRKHLCMMWCIFVYKATGLSKFYFEAHVFLLEGNPNFQGILNCIVQILHYYCRKQHKNIENSQISEQNVVISLCPSLCLLWLAFPSPSSVAEFFQFLDTVLCRI